MTGPIRDERGRFVARPKPDLTLAERVARGQDVRDLEDWYDKGGVLPPAAAHVVNNSGVPERVRASTPPPRRRGRIALRVAIVVLILIALAAAGIWYGHR